MSSLLVYARGYQGLWGVVSCPTLCKLCMRLLSGFTHPSCQRLSHVGHTMGGTGDCRRMCKNILRAPFGTLSLTGGCRCMGTNLGRFPFGTPSLIRSIRGPQSLCILPCWSLSVDRACTVKIKHYHVIVPLDSGSVSGRLSFLAWLLRLVNDVYLQKLNRLFQPSFDWDK